MSWNKYFIEMLDFVSSKSKDPSTKVGAIIVDENNIIVATGFNGFPRNVKEDQSVSERFKRPLKYSFIEHAERNCIYAAARKGIALENCKIYQGWLPCCDCARAIIQVGINKIVVDGRNYAHDKIYWDQRWYDNMIISCDMLREANVEVIFWKPECIGKIPDGDYRNSGALKWHKVKDTGTIQN